MELDNFIIGKREERRSEFARKIKQLLVAIKIAATAKHIGVVEVVEERRGGQTKTMSIYENSDHLLPNIE
jgi:hypothetical protein